MDQAETQSAADRRNFFRVNDNVMLRYRRLSPDEDEEAASDQAYKQQQEIDQFVLAARFSSTTQEMRPLLSTIENRSPEVAKYLWAIDKKLNQMAQIFMMQELQHGGNHIRDVSLGAGGIAFTLDELLPAGAPLEIRLVLVSSMVGVKAQGKVVRSEQEINSEHRYWVAVEFTDIREQDRDLLVRHMLGRQLQERREKKQAE
ncbi:MAG TPA: PilZ domain-containing protein [Acidiferrobacteraceae bacterium]|nr:PilZ domain-containing protein [Acidiferrobacteraceae bacterium]